MENLKDRLLKVTGWSFWDNRNSAEKLLRKTGLVKIVFKPRKYALVEYKSSQEREEAEIVAKTLKGKLKSFLRVEVIDEEDLKEFSLKSSDKRSNPHRDKTCENKGKKMKKSMPETVNDIVMPLHKMPYEKQLELKTKNAIKALKKISSRISKETPHLEYPWKKKGNCICCPFDKVNGAEKINEYRNKESVTMGYSETKEPVVGYRAGRFSDGITHVMSIDSSSTIPKDFKKLAQKLLELCKSTKYQMYSNEGDIQTGVWRKVIFKSGERGKEIRMVVEVYEKELNDEDKNKIKESLKSHFSSDLKINCIDNKLKGILLKMNNEKSDASTTDTPSELIIGDPEIYENINDLRFRISENSFFQVNTEMASVMYNSLIGWSGITKDTVLLDVCCGTGTIGIMFAKHCKKVLGFEIVKEAVEDAIHNSKINQISNAYWFLGDVKNTIRSALENHPSDDYVAIVDPSRGGLHKQVLKSLRCTESIRKVIYVSCNPNSLVNDATYLLKAERGKRPGDPFLPVKATGFDLFPQTNHCELVMLLERAKGKDELPRSKF